MIGCCCWIGWVLLAGCDWIGSLAWLIATGLSRCCWLVLDSARFSDWGCCPVCRIGIRFVGSFSRLRLPFGLSVRTSGWGFRLGISDAKRNNSRILVRRVFQIRCRDGDCGFAAGVCRPAGVPAHTTADLNVERQNRSVYEL